MKDTVILGTPGIILPEVERIDHLHSVTVDNQKERRIGTIPVPEGMNSRQLRRMARNTKFALYAAQQAYKNAPAVCSDGALFFAMTHGATSLLREFHDYMFDFGLDMASPNAFSNGVTNAPLGAVSMMLGLRGGGMTLVGYENVGLEAINHAAQAIAAHEHPMCLVGGAEEYSPYVVEAYNRFGWFTGSRVPRVLPHPPNSSHVSEQIPVSEGSVFFSLAPLGSQTTTACTYSPVDDPQKLSEPVELIISGACGAPHDSREIQVLRKTLMRQNKPMVLFSKLFCGELFGVSPLVSIAIAQDILMNGTPYRSFPIHPHIQEYTAQSGDFSRIKSILVLSTQRDGEVSAGLVRRTGL